MTAQFTPAHEVNFDGLVGPTHNYAGLSYGNVAATSNALKASNPLEGVLQGLGKMRRVRDLGLTQGLLPPQDRPHLATLRALGFSGSDETILSRAYTQAPLLVCNIMSASTMWTANAATVSPSADTADDRVHFTPANLAAMFHRSLEADTTARVLKSVFPDGRHFRHHPPLLGAQHLGDEGAANHNRFASDHGAPGLEVFVYGVAKFRDEPRPKKYPARQVREASEAIARLHGLDPKRTVFVQQNPAAIDAGAFHNDVVAVSNNTVFFYHQDAFADPASMQSTLQGAAGDMGMELTFVEVPRDAVPLGDAITSYLFNSQLLSLPGRERMTLIVPGEVAETPSTKAYCDRLVAGNGPIGHIEVMEVRQSMRNGGGPACLRLRVVLTEEQKRAIGANVLVTDDLLNDLEAWAKRHYRDRITPDDLGDPQLMRESFEALDELTGILQLGPVYDFQR